VEGIGMQLVLIGVLVLLNAFFAGSELALVSLREGQLEKLRERGEAGKQVAELAAEPNRFLSTIQVGITLAGFLASAAAAVSLAEPLLEPLAFAGRWAQPLAIFVVTLGLTYVTLVLGELAPKRVALQRAEGWSLVAARPLSFVAKIARPVIWFLGVSTDLVVRVMGGDPSVQREEMTKEELRDLVASRPGFQQVQRQILSGAFEAEERILREICVPRSQVAFLPADADASDATTTLVSVGHSRAPVRGRDADDIVGVVHLADLVGARGPVTEHARPPLFLPDTLPVLVGLRRMQSQRQHLAIVHDEYGGTEGIVTIEDILEEFVGEIYDEFDRDTRHAERQPDGSVLVSGGFPMHDLIDLDIHLPEGAYTTVAGFVLDRLGRVAREGDVVSEGPYRVHVVDVDGHTVERVRIAAEDADRRAR
jgi:putative hemolysin